MKKNRYLVLPLALLLVGGMFTGCGSKTDSTPENNVSSSDSKTAGDVMTDVEEDVRDIVTDAAGDLLGGDDDSRKDDSSR